MVIPSLASDAVPVTVEQLWTYPIKSCAGIRLSSLELEATGLEWDRAWMLVDEAGEFVSQRELPRMALIRPRFHLGQLEVNAPGMLSLHIPLEASGPLRRVRVWDDEVDAFDMGDPASRWFTECLEPQGVAGALRLVRFDPGRPRWADRHWTGGLPAPNQFSDGFPVLVASSASLDELNRRLLISTESPVGMERFRPNIVLGGLQAHDEDRMGEIHLLPSGPQHGPAAVLKLVKPCSRCSIPDVDPLTAHSGNAVSRTLHSYRQDKRLMGAITFGMNAIVTAGVGHLLHEGMSGTAVWNAWG